MSVFKVLFQTVQPAPYGNHIGMRLVGRDPLVDGKMSALHSRESAQDSPSGHGEQNIVNTYLVD